MTRWRRGEDRGLTLVELMVTMILLGIVTSITVVTVTVIGRATVNDQARGESLDLARIGMNNMTRTIRAGTEVQRSGGQSNLPAFVCARADSVVVYASLGAAPTMVRYGVNSDRDLVESRWNSIGGTPPYYGFPALTDSSAEPCKVSTAYPPTASRVIASKIPTGTTLFVYQDDQGAVITPPTPTDVGALGNIRRVQISLTVDAEPSLPTNPVTLTNTVVLPNLGVVRQ